MPDWVRFAIADAVVIFGSLEQEIIEISWILRDAQLESKLKIARATATENYIAVLESVERQDVDLDLKESKNAFRRLADERNFIVHSSWRMLDDKPWAVWHKFLEDDSSIIGEFFEQWRFEYFMEKAQHLLGVLKQFHDMLELGTGKRTSPVPRT